MAGFFFYLQDGKSELGDDEAQDFSGIVEAEQHARKVADELARNVSPSSLRNSFIVVKAINGGEVARVALFRPARLGSASPSASRKPRRDRAGVKRGAAKGCVSWPLRSRG
jgi:hypothetical protein